MKNLSTTELNKNEMENVFGGGLPWGKAARCAFQCALTAPAGPVAYAACVAICMAS